MPQDAPASPPDPGGPQWLLCVASMPAQDPASRMRVLRTLEALGATVLREGAYLLPGTPENLRSLETLADYVGKTHGTAHVMRVSAVSPAQHEAFARLFDRSARYGELIKTVESLRIGFGQSDPSAIARVLHKQRREFEAIAALDFFPGQARSRAQAALADAESAVRQLLFPAQQAAALAEGEKLVGRTWATRKPLWADRLACAWLIRRFVDPEATLVWLDKSQPAPAGAIGFGFEGAHFANSEERVSYEQMVSRLGLAGRVRFAGHAGPGRLRASLRRARALVDRRRRTALVSVGAVTLDGVGASQLKLSAVNNNYQYAGDLEYPGYPASAAIPAVYQLITVVGLVPEAVGDQGQPAVLHHGQQPAGGQVGDGGAHCSNASGDGHVHTRCRSP